MIIKREDKLFVVYEKDNYQKALFTSYDLEECVHWVNEHGKFEEVKRKVPVRR